MECSFPCANRRDKEEYSRHVHLHMQQSPPPGLPASTAQGPSVFRDLAQVGCASQSVQSQESFSKDAVSQVVLDFETSVRDRLQKLEVGIASCHATVQDVQEAARNNDDTVTRCTMLIDAFRQEIKESQCEGPARALNANKEAPNDDIASCRKELAELAKWSTELIPLKNDFEALRQQLWQELSDVKQTFQKAEEKAQEAETAQTERWRRWNATLEEAQKAAQNAAMQAAQSAAPNAKEAADKPQDIEMSETSTPTVGSPEAREEACFSYQTYALEESVLDASLLLWSKHLGVACSTYGFLLLALNLLVQGIFISTIAKTLTSSSFSNDSSSGFRLWRANVAHDLKYMTAISRESLASRVCAGDPGLEISQGQSDAHDVLSRYLDVDELFGTASGAMILVLCLLVWFMMIVNELEGTLKAALASIPLRGQATMITSSQCGEKYVLSSIGPVRAICFLFIQACRLVIAVVLLVSGVAYLLYTIDIGDIMLNTLALEFVLNVDAMIFTTLSTARHKEMLSAMEDLPLPPIPTIIGVDCMAVSKTTLVLLTLGLVAQLLVLPQIDILWENKDALCAGSLDFVYALSATGHPWWGISESRDDAPDFRVWTWPQDELGTLDFAAKLIDAVINEAEDFQKCDFAKCTVGDPMAVNWGIPTCCWIGNFWAPGLTGGEFSVEAFAEISEDEAGLEYNPFCADFMDIPWWAAFFYSNPFADATSSDACPGGCSDRYRPFCRDGECVAPSCQDALQFCNDDSLAGTRARMWCPVTCQCHVPNSTLLLSTPGYGCVPTCTDKPIYKSIIEILPCEDALPGSKALTDFANEWTRVASTWTTGKMNIASAFASKLKHEGCKNYSVFTQMYFGLPFDGSDIQVRYACGGYNPVSNIYAGPGTMPIKPLGYVCPETCKCKKGVFGCPSTCPTEGCK